jgi:hypothetical protein
MPESNGYIQREQLKDPIPKGPPNIFAFAPRRTAYSRIMAALVAHRRRVGQSKTSAGQTAAEGSEPETEDDFARRRTKSWVEEVSGLTSSHHDRIGAIQQRESGEAKAGPFVGAPASLEVEMMTDDGIPAIELVPDSTLMPWVTKDLALREVDHAILEAFFRQNLDRYKRLQALREEVETMTMDDAFRLLTIGVLKDPFFYVADGPI